MRKEPIRVKNINKIVPIGQKIEVYIADGNFKGSYSSYTYDVDEKFIYIFMPTNRNGLKAVIRKNEEFDISFVDDKTRRIGFSAILKDVMKKEDKVIYKIEKPEEIMYRMELRENFRVDVLTESDILYMKHSEVSKNKGTIVDISASGAKLSVGIAFADKLEIGDVIFISFNLGDVKVNNVEAKIIRKSISKRKGANHYGLHFISLDRKLEDDIIKFCIKNQIKMARKMRGL